MGHGMFTVSSFGVLIACAFAAIAAGALDGQATADSTEAATQAPASPSATEPPGDAKPVQPEAIVMEVAGVVDRAAPGTSPLVAEGWTAITVNDRLAPGTLIRTGLRSHVNLQFGVTTTVSIRSASFASIDQYYRSATTETVRVGLGYGTVRGGSTEGTIRSDVSVDTPVATLAKRGTEGWEVWSEAATGRFTISLAEYGLVEAVKKLPRGATQSRSVRPGEYATQANIANMWIEQDIFDRKVWFYDAAALSDGEADFAAANSRGYATLGPGAGREVLDFSGRASGDFGLQQTAGRLPPRAVPPGFAISRPIDRPEGNFGTAAAFKPIIRR